MEAQQTQDLELTCIDCGSSFAFTVKDQEFFAQKGFTQPKRCRKCRMLKKQRIQDRHETHNR